MKRFVLFVFAACLASWALFAFRHEVVTPVQGLLGLVILWGGLVPGVVYQFSRPSDNRTVPIMALTGLFYSVFFGLPVFLVDLLVDPINDLIRVYEIVWLRTYRTDVLVLLAGGIALMFGAWYFVRKVMSKWPVRLSLPYEETDTNAVVALMSVLAMVHIAYLYIPQLRALPSIGQFIQPAGYVALGYFFIAFRRRLASRWISATYFVVAMPLIMLRLMESSFLTPVMLGVVLLVSLYALETGRIPVKTMGTVALVFVLVYPAMWQIRGMLWNKNAFDRGFSLSNMVSKTF